jgi:hypothetical protein
MRRLARFLLLILCAVALTGGSAISFAASAAAAGPCPHEQGHHQGPDQHKHHDAGCLACCLGACVAIPDLPPRTLLGEAPFAATPVSYWETEAFLSGRSIRPDPGPPRTRA